MTPDFSIQFVINRVTATNYILLTDATTDATNIKGNFKVTYPDGSIYENSDFSSPDISALLGTKQITLKNGSNGEVQTGSYTFIYTVIDQDDDTILGTTKTFTFSFDEPEMLVTDTSDLAIPRIAFSVPFDYEVTGYTETISNFEIDVDFPSTSAISGSSLNKDLTSGDREILVINGVDYYEGSYSPVSNFVALYQNDSLSYLSVSWTQRATSTFALSEIKTASELLELIETYKETESCNLEEYNRIISLYLNLEAGVRAGSVDEGNVLLSELYTRLGITSSVAYQSEPIDGLVFSSTDLTNYYTKSEVDTLINNILSSLGLTEAITVSVSGGGIGGFDYEQVASSGTSFTDMWKELLRKAVPPTYTAPTIAILGSNLDTGTTSGEVGVNQTVTITPTFTQNDGGASNEFVLNKNDVGVVTDNSAPIPNASYNNAINGVEGTYTYDGDLSYDQGAVKNNDLGEADPTGRIEAGTITSNEVEYNIVYPWFFGTSSDQSISGADVYSGTKVVEVIGASIQAGFSGSDTYFWFAVPSDTNNDKTYTAWEDDDDSNNAGAIGGTTNLFGDPSTVEVSSSGLDSDWAEDYDVYVTNWKTEGTTLNLS